jgi:hypothetical protein
MEAFLPMKTLLGSLMLAFTLAGSAQTLTTTSLVADKQTGPLGTIFTLTATVTDGQGPVKLGQITFYDGDPSGPAAALGTVVLNGANGTATFKRAFILGSRAITAKFLGTNTDAPSSSSSPTITVTGKYASTTTVFPVSDNGSQKLVASVAGQGLIPITGSVTFTDTTTNMVLGTPPLNTALLRTSFSDESMTTTYSTYVITGDFNGDGIPDLVTDALNFQGHIQILLGKGDGSFGPPKVLSLNMVPPYFPIAFVAGDFNGDGKLDLAVLLSGGPTFLEIALGHGDGSFEMLPLTPAGSGDVAGNISPMAVGDFNGDGKLDLAVETNDPGPVIMIMLGHGNGTFQITQKLSIGNIGNAESLVTGDFNGDGKSDIAIPGPILYLSHGNGTFAPGLFPGPFGGGTFVTGDFNGDGKLDFAEIVFVPQVGLNQISVLLNHDGKSFDETDTKTALTAPYYLAAGDFNGDGKSDLIVIDATTSRSPQYQLLLGHGDGSFLGMSSGTISHNGETIKLGVPITGDFDGDGNLDFGVNVFNATTDAPTVDILHNNGTSTAAAGLTSFTLTGAGTHSIDATYSGDEDFTGSTGRGVVKQP